MGFVVFKGYGETHTAPVGRPELGTLPEESIVMINENGSPVPFYLAKHDYESELNGNGRTLMVRQDAFSEYIHWHTSSGTNNLSDYLISQPYAWLNSTYKGYLDTAVQSAIGTTSYYYIQGGGTSGTIGEKVVISSDVLLLSLIENGISEVDLYSYDPKDGSELPIASTLRNLGKKHFTRTPMHTTANLENTGVTNVISYITEDGKGISGSALSALSLVRPAFTLPANTLTAVNEDGSVTLIM